MMKGNVQNRVFNNENKTKFCAQVRKIVLVQSYVRRWLARTRYQKVRWQMASSVVTLQRYLRGWIARRDTQTLRNKVTLLS